MATGRTLCRYSKFQIDDGTAMRDIPVSTWGDIGFTYDEVDMTAQQDGIKNYLNGLGSMSVTISGPFDNSAAIAASASGEAPKLSGSHTVLSALNGSNVARSFGVYLGIQGNWATGDPVFGAIDSVVVSQYTVNPGDVGTGATYSAKLTLSALRTNDPAWGTAAIAVSS